MRPSTSLLCSALFFIGQNPQTAITRQELKTVSEELMGLGYDK